MKIEKAETKIFKATQKILKIENKDNLTVILDRSNNIYIIENITKPTRTVKTVELPIKISDFSIINDHILAVSPVTMSLFHIGFDGSFEQFTKKLFNGVNKNRKLRGFKKIIFNENIYLLSESLFVLNEDYQLIYVIEDGGKDFTVFRENVVILNNSNEIIKYKKSIAVDKKIFDDCFSFSSIFSSVNYIYLPTSYGIRALNEKMECVGVYRTNFSVVRVVENNGIVILMGNELNQVRGMQIKNFKGVVNFPQSGVNFPRITSVCENNDFLFYSHTNYVSAMTLSK